MPQIFNFYIYKLGYFLLALNILKRQQFPLIPNKKLEDVYPLLTQGDT